MTCARNVQSAPGTTRQTRLPVPAAREVDPHQGTGPSHRKTVVSEDRGGSCAPSIPRGSGADTWFANVFQRIAWNQDILVLKSMRVGLATSPLDMPVRFTFLSWQRLEQKCWHRWLTWIVYFCPCWHTTVGKPLPHLTSALAWRRILERSNPLRLTKWFDLQTIKLAT